MNAQRPDPDIDRLIEFERQPQARVYQEPKISDEEIQRRAVVAVSGVVTSAGHAFMRGFFKVLLLVLVIGAMPYLSNGPDSSGVVLFGIGALLIVGVLYQIFLRCYRK